jgi:tRNA A-37 threonylcarbamoyl transferase component Bud32
VVRAPLVLSKHLWVWPVVGAFALSLVGWWVHRQLDAATRHELADRLQTLLRANVSALRLWLSEQEADARSFAMNANVQSAVAQLAALSTGRQIPDSALANSPAAQALESYLMPLLTAQHYVDFVVAGADRRILASPRKDLVGQPAPPGYELFLDRALAGHTVVSRPFLAEPAPDGGPGRPTIFAAAPVRSEDGRILGVLALRMRPEDDFSRIFLVARMGQSGESYAFDQQGLMLTPSRFDEDLKVLGLIPAGSNSTAMLDLRLLDPGADLRQAGATTLRTHSTNLTWMATAAIEGGYGCEVKGYRNYRGIKVVGAWQWLPVYGAGVATEVSAEEAFQSLFMLRKAFFVLFMMLLLAGVGLFSFTVLVERLQSSLRRSALAARRLGQYVLDQEIGRGATGIVYRARHAMLRRPVAIKLLSPDMTNEANTARFEQEVQLTSELTHPNTVAVFDYGRTPDGLFYYAMEYLSGINLDRLVRQFGPQPEGRVIHILRQICGSLTEAHKVGLIHRDIKPANIVLTRRGTVYDVVKVLDFGVVKAARAAAAAAPHDALVGTPHFMPPEAIQCPEKVDARSDLYSLGAVGYWLLTGRTVFEGASPHDLMAQHVATLPLSPSERLGAPVSKDLEQIVMRCLAKEPAGRPANAGEVEEALGLCVSAGAWTRRNSEQWWQENTGRIEVAPTLITPEKTLVIAVES